MSNIGDVSEGSEELEDRAPAWARFNTDNDTLVNQELFGCGNVE
jgi:hypothetical protein